MYSIILQDLVIQGEKRRMERKTAFGDRRATSSLEFLITFFFPEIFLSSFYERLNLPPFYATSNLEVLRYRMTEEVKEEELNRRMEREREGE